MFLKRVLDAQQPGFVKESEGLQQCIVSQQPLFLHRKILSPCLAARKMMSTYKAGQPYFSGNDKHWSFFAVIVDDSTW